MTFVVAEIGINHNGDVGIACKMVEMAAIAGADAIKLQNYRTEDFVSDKALTYSYTSQGIQVCESQYDMFKRYEIDFEFLYCVKKACDDNNIKFLSTPTNNQGVDDLIRLGCKYIKNGSDFITNLDLIKAMHETDMTVVLSTGMSSVFEIDPAISIFKSSLDRLILLQCTSSYPTNDLNVNLSRMLTLSRKYGCRVGFSDHTIDSFAAVMSTALGACFIEKHFTLDHSMKGPDHWFSITPSELTSYVHDIRRAQIVMGNNTLKPSDSELITMSDAKLSLIYNSNLSIGHVINSNDIGYSRPGTGIPPADLEQLIGRKLKTNVIKSDFVDYTHLSS